MSNRPSTVCTSVCKGFFLAMLLWCVACCGGEEITAVCWKVQDGDTITLSTGDKVRLHGIDAPESGQAYGGKSRAYLSSLVGGKTVRVEFDSKDRYGRLLGRVYVDGTYANLAMLQAGLAWHYKQYDKTEEFAVAEQDARKARRGMWASNDNIPPWEYRHSPKITPKPGMYWVAGKVHNGSCKHYGEGKRGYETATPPADKQDGKCCGGRHANP